ncbi:Sensor histidine kinase WalK [Fundidesulfovibrio magnetotacticus]|uniref:Sensor histidine kinase WalK n=1 Tax=Fundidesulfovibrio magnetotacticus TaxID=2730080 RepID=A0A6V8LNX3_9BACT|nr:HAMP domain-containing sensor histidine kinase [Fundidesulfovibrio magnetotacticus]GFK92211.1 Sensor histidine kinase WalK [Fundidesulfovibrio magnetotacticus]
MDAELARLTNEALLTELESSKNIIKTLENALAESASIFSKAREAELVIEYLREKLRDKDVKEHVMCHDIRNSIAPLVQIPEVIIEDVTLSEEQAGLLSSLKISAQRALRILDIHLLSANISRGVLNCKMHKVDMYSIVIGVAGHMESTAKLKNVSIRTTCSMPNNSQECYIPCMCNEDIMFSVLSNIILNAIEASPNNSEVCVTIKSNEVQEVSVSNTGEVPDSIRSVFFDKYVTSGKASGTGIGTYSAKLFTEAQGGNIFLDTSKSGLTTVTLMFPKPSVEKD